MTEAAQAQQTPEAISVAEGGAGTATATVDREAYEAERAAEEQASLLAGKYKTPEDLEKGYLELQKKLGEQPSEEPEETAEETTEETAEGEAEEATESVYGEAVQKAIDAAGIDVDAEVKNFEADGKLSDEAVEKFEKAGFPKEVVDAYLRGVTGQQQQVQDTSQSQIEAIKASVGGEESFGKLQDFIRTQFTQQERQAYNDAVSSGDIAKAQAAVTAANQKMAAEFGTEGELIGGKTTAGTTGFAGDAEMMEAMADPRYKTSQAYRDQVAARIAASSYMVTR